MICSVCNEECDVTTSIKFEELHADQFPKHTWWICCPMCLNTWAKEHPEIGEILEMIYQQARQIWGDSRRRFFHSQRSPELN